MVSSRFWSFRFLLCFVFTLSVTVKHPASPSLQFTQRTITATAGGARSVYAADLDNDGSLDVLSGSKSDDTVAWYRNGGSGSFSAPRVITTAADYVASVYAADLQNDGFPDVLSASWHDNKIAWYCNDGSGKFSVQRVITTSAYGAVDVRAADLDNDGYLDVLTSSFLGETIAWYRNVGGGEFSGPHNVSVNSLSYAVYAADLDKDGSLDLISALGPANSVVWYRNNGSGGFLVQQVLTTSASWARDVYAVDLDNDGLLDVLSASSGDNKIAWYRNEGAGRFSPQRVITIEANAALSVYAVDLDNDGLLDVLSASLADHKVAWYRNEGAGRFSGQRVITITAEEAWSVYAADLDDDGLLDVLSASDRNDMVAWYRNEGAAPYSTEVIIGTGKGATYAQGADLNGDGLMDVLCVSVKDDKVAVFHSRGDGTIATTPSFTTSLGGARAALAADLNGDGLLDILCASFSTEWNTVGRVSWFQNQGQGSFSSAKFLTQEKDGALTLTTADIDGDGKLDVVVASADRLYLAWFKNEGLGEFSSQKHIAALSTVVYSVKAADLDHDGHPDVLTASPAENSIAWYRNEGNGLFSERTIISTATKGPRCIAAADLDGDGLNDILSASEHDNTIAWFRNEGRSRFSGKRIITSEAQGASFVLATDLDLDGWLDVLSASYVDNKVAFYRNQGHGVFSPQRIVSVAAKGASAVHAADLDGDGYPDVISASAEDNKFAAYYLLPETPVILDPEATETTCLQSKHCPKPLPALSTEPGPYAFILRMDMVVRTQWLFPVGYTFTLLGNGHTLHCQIEDAHGANATAATPCITVLARQTASIFNVTIMGNHFHFPLLEARFVRDLRLYHVTFRPLQSKLWAHPVVRIFSQQPPMQSGVVALQAVTVATNILAGTCFEFLNLSLVMVLNSTFQNTTMIPMPLQQNSNGTQDESFAVFRMQGVQRTHVQGLHVQNCGGSFALLHSKGAGELLIQASSVQGTTNFGMELLKVQKAEAVNLVDTEWRQNRCIHSACRAAVLFAQEVGSLSIRDTSFDSNECSGCTGDAMQLLFTGEIVTLVTSTNSTFTNNFAARGGAVAVVDRTTSLDPWRPSLVRTLSNLTFVNNTAFTAGGALFWDSAVKYAAPPGTSLMLQDKSPHLILSECKFLSNSAPRGGAVAMYNANLAASSCDFQSNYASQQGGALWLSVVSAVFSACTLSGNQVNLSHAVLEGTSSSLPQGGGALFTQQCSSAGVAIVGSALNKNSVHTASGMGGAVLASECSVHIVDSVMEANTVTSKGGALACLDCNSFDMRQVVMLNNEASAAGGAVWMEATPLTARQWHCAKNNVSASSASEAGSPLGLRGRHGGSVSAGGCLAIMKSNAWVDAASVLVDNSVTSLTGTGGAMFLDCTSTATVTGDSFVGNNSAAIGSDIFVECYEASGTCSLQVPDAMLQSHTVESATARLQLENSATSLVNSIASTAPVATYLLLDAFEFARWEDNTTSCTVSALGGQRVSLQHF